jgi:flagellar M-ring protein FliF
MDFQALLKRVKEMPWAGQWRLLTGMGLLVFGALALGLWGMAPDYAPLYPSLAEKDSGAVMTALDTAGYPYKLGPNGALLVERSKVYEARYKLAAQGLPKSGTDAGTEPPKFGASTAQEQAYQQKLKELELARSINGIGGISGARVHLALPHQTIFGKETSIPTASVAIDGSSISRSQAAAIAHLVANAVPGLQVNEVSIIDDKGRLLTQDGQDSGDTPEQRAYAKEMRADLQARVERLLEPLLGRGGAKAEIDVALEFGNEEAVTETWRPNVGEAAIRSQQSSDSRQGSVPAAGVPGSATNTLPLALPLPATPTAAGSSNGSSQATTNYELDRSVVKSARHGAKVRRIRAAVLVDYKRALKDGAPQNTPWSPQDLAKIQALIQESIGIDEDRGDSVQVINMAFVEQAATVEEGLPIWRDPYMVEMALTLAKWLVIALGLFWVARQARSTLVALAAPEKPVEQVVSEAIEGAAVGATAVSKPVDLNALRQVAQANPQAVASVIKGWVDGDGNE